MQVKFKDDSARLKDEFDSKVDHRLQYILTNLAGWIDANLNKELVITCLLRDATENAALPGSNPQSAHLRGDAADIRSRDFTTQEVDAIVAFIKKQWGPVVHCLFHNPGGNAPHIHLNINWPYSAKNNTTA